MREGVRGLAIVLSILCVFRQLSESIRCQDIFETDALVFPDDSGSTSPGTLPLYDLVETHPEASCPDNSVLVQDKIEEQTRDNAEIPRYIHVTGKSRCVTPQFAANLEKWKQLNYTFLFHNDAAMERLLVKHWPEFPHLQQGLLCTTSGAGRADLWRALVLWEYGGVYTDFDNAPGPLFNSTSISPDDQAFFLVENEGFLSQYFFAAKPRHPLLYFLIQSTLHRLMDLNDVDNQYVPYVTGPGALKSAFIQYMQAQEQNLPRMKGEKNSNNRDKYATYQLVRSGLYTGWQNSTVRVEGSRQSSDRDWVHRNVIPRKKNLYRSMNMTHFGSIPRRRTNTSCWQRILENF